MAITNAQQYQQLVNKPANGKRPGYRGDAAYGSRSRSNQATSSRAATSSRNSSSPGGASLGGGRDRNETPAVDRSSELQTYNTKKATGKLGRQDPMGGELQYRNGVLIDETGKSVDDTFRGGFTGDLTDNEKTLETFIDSKANYSKYTPGLIRFLGDLNRRPNRKYFVENVLRAGKIPGVDYSTLGEDEFDIEKAYKDYMNNRLAGKTDAMGNPMSGFEYGDDNTLTGNFMDNDGGDQQTDPCLGPNPPAYCKVNNDDDDDTVNPRDYTGLGSRFLGSEFDFTGLADGGIARAGYMDGGMPEYQGGIMDLETGRQQYFLGKLVKKATRAIKKVVKSPIGKAALLYFGGGALGNLAGGSGLGGMFKGAMTPGQFFSKNKLANIFTKGGGKNILFGGQKLMGNAAKNNLVDFSGILGSGGKFSIGKALNLGLGIPTAMELLGIGKEEDEELNLGPGINVADIRANPYKYLAPRFTGSQFAADGGRMGYAEGSKEPVAKETMPLLDMDNQEMDLRQEGGFVPIGRMERADDVPARLSKNEFVFTADAVRNAGEGDIDKGAEVMYNMMKNLESGGEVSEESQGLDGAREMFQTSQRLEEVL